MTRALQDTVALVTGSGSHAALPHLLRAAGDSPREVADLINISSIARRVARPGGSVYSLTKFGIAAFAESLRQELIANQVRASAWSSQARSTQNSSRIFVRTCAGRRGPRWSRSSRCGPEDVADAVSYIITRDRRVAVPEILVRAAEQSRAYEA